MNSEDGMATVVDAYAESPSEGIENVRLEARTMPDPGVLAPTDVVVRVRSVAVGWVDLLMLSGQYQHMVQPPYTPGLEYSGVVEWVGDAVGSVRVGDRVMADAFSTGPRSKGTHQKQGGMATWAVAPEHALHPLPGGWSFDQGCNFFGNYETAYHCLITRGGLREGQWALIHGATGSTGLAAVHVAKLVGAKVIATGRNPAKLEVVQAQGADHVVAMGEGSLRDAVKQITGGPGVDVVYDGVGGDVSIESLRCVRFGAKFLIVGWASTPLVAKGKGERGAPRANVLPTNLIMMKGLDVLGCPTVISTERDPSLRDARMRALAEWIDQGRLIPMAGEVYSLDQVKEAMRAKWESRFVGGCVIRP